MIKAAIKRSDLVLLDELFETKPGYILDFSNQTFAEFFADELSVDIDDSKWHKRGSSKAKRLRYFLKTVEPSTAAKTIRALWAYREALATKESFDEEIPGAASRLTALVDRLDGPDPESETTIDRNLSTTKKDAVRLSPRISSILSRPSWTGIGVLVTIVLFALGYCVTQPSTHEADVQRLENSREALHAFGPSKEQLIAILEQFPFGDFEHTSLDEAERMMDFLRPTSRISIPVVKNDQVSGSFGPLDAATGHGPYQVTIWKETYDFPNRYGLRFGKPSNPSWGCNDSYFEIHKTGSDRAKFIAVPDHLPSDFAKCL